MDTFGPVLLYNRNPVRIGSTAWYMPVFPSALPRASGYFWGDSGPDDEKPVVHSKVGQRQAAAALISGNYHLLSAVQSLPYWSNSTYRYGWSAKSGYTLFYRVTSFGATQSSASGKKRVVVLPGSYGYLLPTSGTYFPGTEIELRLHLDPDWSYLEGHRGTWFDARLAYLEGNFLQRLGSKFYYALLAALRDYLDQARVQIRSNNGAYGYRALNANQKDILASILFDVSVDYDGFPSYGPVTAVKPVRLTASYLPSRAIEGFLFSDDNISLFGTPGSLTTPAANYFINSLKAHAFLDACDHMPALSDNSISNITEILEFILSVVRHEPPKLPASLSDIWLAYRYQYSTTKMDVSEAWDFVNRYYDLGSMYPTGKAHGVAYDTWKGQSITCRCSFRAAPSKNRPINDLFALWRDLSKLGLAPDLYYLWDSTPFSFMVDWFIPVGDVLSAIDASMLYSKQCYEFSDIVYSLKYANTVDDVPYSCYCRWIEHSTPSMSPLYFMEPASASTRQVAYRALDAASIFLGG